MIRRENQTTADRSAGTEVLTMPAELDLAIGNSVVKQGYAAIARSARLLLLDLTGLPLCDAPRAPPQFHGSVTGELSALGSGSR